MTRLDRYILREAFPPFAFGLLLYVGLILLSNLLGRAQWLVGVEFWGLVRWLWYQVPFVLNQTLPVAVLLATLLAYGRLSRENELLVIQAGGLPLLRTARWLFVAAFVLVGVSLYMSETLIPRANERAAVLWWDELTSKGNGLARLAGQDVPVGPYRLFFARYDYRTKEMVGVRLELWQGETLAVIFADRGRLEENRLRLVNFRQYTLDLTRLPLPDFASLEEAEQHLRRLVRMQNVARDPSRTLTVLLPKTRSQLLAQHGGGGFEDANPISYWYERIQKTVNSPREHLEARVQFHSMLAVPFANLVVLVLALPIAVRKAGSTGLAFGYSLIVTIGYYLVFTLGKLLALNGVVPPELGAWGANLLALGLAWVFGEGVYR
ncbi:LptF/LptG family permease [Marinithermus hydrothermalis]|uniref:Permease YjgP/YjgQ family protein n=1 Tax=Marinithermus hydrothermalis (strain DSM 14884 / JCM 11576 / T1) TaxID=869210 RepID=F2NLW8_MARHT|nr:LptF/LptG family permease [Marinithermus hydrothermalis]AEB11225.1 permease YjgP/YjgQ family protein [Marinithermus hydrothermalis DSM 14884]